jgi:hypothetical protein
MSCVGQKGSQLPEATTFADSDFVLGFVDEGGGNLVTKKIRKDNFSAGPQGEQGDQGPAGPTGPAGAAGESSDWLYSVERSAVFFNSNQTSIGDVWNGVVSANDPFAGDDNTPQGREFVTSSSVNNSAYLDSGTASYQFLTLRTQLVVMGRLAALPQLRSWIGFCAGSAASFFAAGDLPAINFVAFRYSVNSDTTWQAIVGDGASTTVVDTGIAPSATVAQTFRIEWDRAGSQVKFYIDSTLVATINTTLPASGTNMHVVAGVTTLLNLQTRSFIFNVVKTREGIVN